MTKRIIQEDDSAYSLKQKGDTIKAKPHFGYHSNVDTLMKLTNTGNGYIAKFPSHSCMQQDYYVCLAYDQADYLMQALAMAMGKEVVDKFGLPDVPQRDESQSYAEQAVQFVEMIEPDQQPTPEPEADKPWYPPQQAGFGPWIEYDAGAGIPVEGDEVVCWLLKGEREDQSYTKATHKVSDICWDHNIVAYAIKQK